MILQFADQSIQSSLGKQKYSKVLPKYKVKSNVRNAKRANDKTRDI